MMFIFVMSKLKVGAAIVVVLLLGTGALAVGVTDLGGQSQSDGDESAEAAADGTGSDGSDADITLAVDLADEELAVGETTTATFVVEDVPEGSSGASIEISLDDDVAAITEVRDNSFSKTINDEIESDYDGAAPSIGIGVAGGVESGDVIGTYVIEGQGDGETALELTDFSLTDDDSNVIDDADYDEPTITVSDD